MSRFQRVYYVYTLSDPRDGAVFYVGKGKGNRSRQHVAEWRRGGDGNSRKLKRIGDVAKSGHEVVVTVIADGMTEPEAYRLEREEIAKCRATASATLTNWSRGNRCKFKRALDKANYTLSRFRTPEQYEASRWRDIGRAPTPLEWDWYYSSLLWLADIREEAMDMMRQAYGAEKEAG